MHQVTIDGITYAPVGATESPRIGVAVTTHNRSDVFERSMAEWRRHSPESFVFVVVDDASDVPVQGADFRFDENVGIAVAKNKCLELLMAAGVDHLFLADDDVFPASPDWWAPYVASPEPHLMLTWGEKAYFQRGTLRGYPNPRGCLLYAERRVVDRVGGMDPAFGKWGNEHISWSDRIHSAGLTTCRYQDVEGSEDLFTALDRSESVKSSVAESAKGEANVSLLEASRNSDAFIPYAPETATRKGVALSILVPSVHTRRATFGPKIQDQLFGQFEALPATDRARVEVLMLTDAKGVTLGTKRNQMLQIARGEYVVFVDDDDRLEPDYIASLLTATESGADVLTFRVSVSINGGEAKDCVYSLRFAEDENTAEEYHRLPNHICAVKRDIALRTMFADVSLGEDSDYSRRLRPLLHTEHAIDRVLYHYDYSDQSSETQVEAQARRALIDRLSKPLTVDLVMLSRSSTPEVRAMTQKAIRSAVEGAPNHRVNVVVVEQVPGVRYDDATMIYETGEFAYNRFGNIGAETGSAPWIMLANNDLEFEPGWLDALLAAKHDVVSPANPGDARQHGVTKNEVGEVNGKHFSGWCFMIRRTLWEKIGGFDPDFVFWCADDSVIEQVKRAGVKPMLVPAAKVRHLTSKTIGEVTLAPGTDDGALTWAMVHLFEQKYGVRKFQGDTRYTTWKRRNNKS